jgi:hypothetical protein
MIGTVSITDLHLEYQLWLRELTFYKEEIKIFEAHLETLANRNNKKAAQAQIEHFQNQFIRHKEVIDILKHDLQVSERQLASFVFNLTRIGFENIKMDNHGSLRDRILVFKKIYSELKQEFRRFETKWI